MTQPTDESPDERHGAKRPHRRWFQFSLRSLLIGVTLVAGIVFTWSTYVEPYRRQRETMEAIKERGGTFQTAEAPKWMTRLWGADFQNVTAVDVADVDISNALFEQVTALPELRTLAIGGANFTDDHLRRLHRLVHLSALLLDSTSVSDEGVAALAAALPGLEYYRSDRRAIAAVTDDRMTISKEWRPVPLALKELFADDFFVRARSVHVTPDRAFAADAHAPVVEYNLRFLQRFVDLKVLDLGYTRIRDADLAELEPLQSLTHLNLHFTAVGDAGLQHLRPLQRLQLLHLESTKLTDRGLASLERLPGLKVLDVSGTAVTDAGLRHLAMLTTLRELNLSDTGITDDGLRHLEALPELRDLTLSGTRVSDQCIVHLRSLRNLSRLALSQTAVTRAGAEELERALPQCTIKPAFLKPATDEP